MRVKIVAALVLLLVGVITCQVGPYPSVGQHPRAPRLRSTNGFTHTNLWWSNWNLGQGANPIQTYPFVVRTSTQGFHIAYGGVVITSPRNVQTVVNDNLVFSTREAFGAAMIDASTVNGDAFDLAAKVNFGTNFDVTVIRGTATILVNVRSSTPVLKTIHAILSATTPAARTLKLVFNNNQEWFIQTQYPVVWSTTATEITAPSAYTGWIKISIVTNFGAEQLLTQTIDSVVTNGRVSYAVNRPANQVSVTVTYSADNVHFVMPHMTNVYTSINSAGGDAKGIKGTYKMQRGTSYTYNLPIYTGGNPQAAVDTAQKRTKLGQALTIDVGSVNIGPKDPYFGGKAMARVATLIEIADLLGDQYAKDRMYNMLIDELDAFWFAPGDPKLVYEPTWGGIVSKSSVGDFGADFGNYVYNDHHFHYGYFVYVASVLARLYPTQYNARLAYFEPIVADYAGTCKYANMPCRARNKDAFLGFSYAGGLNEFGDSKDQESSSESVNSYLSLRKLAQATANTAMLDLADYLLSSEINSCQTYWHIKDTSIYANPFAANGVVGIVWETKADYTTWFGANTEFIWAIQILPITDMSPALLTRSWLQQTRSVWRAALDSILPSQGKFADIMLIADAIADPTRPGLSQEIHSLNVFDDGNCRTIQYYIFYMLGGTPIDGDIVTPPPTATTVQPGGTTAPPTGSCGTDTGRPDGACPGALLGCFNGANQLQGCYNVAQYTCYAGGYLCPNPLCSCLAHCYDPAIYGCSGGNLVVLGKK